MSIQLERLSKRYEGHAVVNDVSLEVGDGELFVLLGPSGSGKSTVLRLIAGLVAADGGRVVLHGKDVTRLPPQRRGVGLVFQNYALFRHMTVSENIEFGLRVRRIGGGERTRRRDELLDLVGLSGLGDRLPRQLSGGQQQRVALARALAIVRMCCCSTSPSAPSTRASAPSCAGPSAPFRASCASRPSS